MNNKTASNAATAYAPLCKDDVDIFDVTDPFFDLFTDTDMNTLDLEATSLIPEDDHLFANDVDDIASVFDILAAEEKKSRLSKDHLEIMKAFGISHEKMIRILETNTSAEPHMKDLPATFVPLKSFLPPSAIVVDPRCFELTSFSKGNIDPRIPSSSIPKMDNQAIYNMNDFINCSTSTKSRKNAAVAVPSDHDPNICDICKSNKTPQRKAILHRWRIRRRKRNWIKGPRYNARSSVASNRVRVNGRFISSGWN